jgi:ABC-type nitrate/sulfonate/bicarbonate transport system substrate-binding protein
VAALPAHWVEDWGQDFAADSQALLEQHQVLVEALQAPLLEAGHLAQAELQQAQPQEAEAVADPAPPVRVERRCPRRGLHKKYDLRAA